MKRTIILCIMFIFVTGIDAEPNWEVAMVADAVRAAKAPSSVIATVCWPTYQKLQLHSALSGISIQFTKPNQDVNIGAEEQYILFVVDLKCDDIHEHLKLHNIKKHFRSPFRWMLLDPSYNDTEAQSLVPDYLVNINILPDGEVIVSRPVANESYEFHKIFKISSNTPWRTEFYGSWDPQSRFQKTIPEGLTSVTRRLDLEGLVVPVCYVVLDNNTFNHLTDNTDLHIDSITKVNIPTVNYLLHFLNATPSYVFENTWGYKVNGSWTGLTGHLISKRCQIGGTPMFILSERLRLLEYVSMPTPSQAKFVFQQPKLSYTSNLFLLSFNSSVWYSLMVLVFLMFLALFAVANWEWKRNKDSVDMQTNTRILRGNVQDVVLLIFGAACQQGSPVELKGSLGRIVMLILFLTLMFLYTSYSANIVALLQSSSSQIKTLEDLLQSRLKLGTHDTVYNRHYFTTATDPVQKAIYETKIAPRGVKPRFISMEDGVKNIQKGLYAFHMELGIGYRLVNKFFLEGQKCGLGEINFFQMADPYQAITKNTPYKEMYKIGFKRIHEHGLQKRENARIYENRPKCSGREAHFISVSMVDCYPALVVLAYGMIISMFLFVMEILMKKRQSIANTVCCRHVAE